MKNSNRAAFGVVAATAVIALAATSPAYAAVPTDTSALRDAVTVEGVMSHLEEFQSIADVADDTRASGTDG